MQKLSTQVLDIAMLACGIADPSQNDHVALLLSPWTYSTCRGS